MRLRFYGVRGSIASPGADTAKYGGNTSCVHVELAEAHDLLFDAGTGLRIAGSALARKDTPVIVALTHQHWDHIQGYPFFAPVYQPHREIKVLTGTESTHNALCSLFEQMDGFNFPLKAEDLPSRAECVVGNSEGFLHGRGINGSTITLNHPGGGLGYRLEEDGVSCAYMTDNELEPPGKPGTLYDQFVEFLDGVDVLIHDAQYTASDMPLKHGWGHSLVSQVRQLALDARVGALVLFHHDPDRTDSQLDAIQRENETFFGKLRVSTKTVCAWEGLAVSLRRRADRGVEIAFE